MSQAAVADRVPAPVRVRGPIALSIGLSRWTGYAWGAIAATIAFIAMTCWWLTQDHSIPIYDAGNHLGIAFEYRDMIQAGDLLGPFEYVSVYPPLAHMIGALGVLVGGVNLAAPIIANNLVFVSLLALGSYRTGRLLFGSAAGMLAVIVALASPLLIELLHVFMLDPPMTALVAVSIWLLLASEDFSRVGVSAAAGLAAGAGMLIKVQFALYVVGLVSLMLMAGGWRNLRGLAMFAVVAAVVGLPWYIDHASLISSMLEVAKAHPTNTAVAVPPPPGNIPPTLSITNLLWYLWSILNLQLLAPLFLVAVGGTVWLALTLARRVQAPLPQERRTRHLRLEFLLGAFLTWLIITLTPHHDVRYGLPLLAYVAVLATGWIVFLPRAPRIAVIALLAVGVAMNTLGVTFGVGREKTIALASPPPSTQQMPDRIVLYPSTGFLSAGPSRNGDVPGLLDALHRNGVRTVTWSLEQSRLADFSFEGLLALARIAGLQPGLARGVEFSRSPEVATLIHQPITPRTPPTCTRVKDISEVWVNRYEPAVTGVWVVRFDVAAGKLAFYCPTRRPQYYGIGQV
ncbi:MAG TPA: glycosyltransferase family 39 protein [Solirubrobacteraceae bacterium]|jgi:4-amino-4-deoxy-L-arabinose transferase-like glycosyltransferase